MEVDIVHLRFSKCFRCSLRYSVLYFHLFSYRFLSTEPITATKISSITTTTTSDPDTLTTSVVSSYPGIHGTKKSHITTFDTTTPESSSDLPVPLSVVIVPVIVTVIGIVLGIMFVRRKRYGTMHTLQVISTCLEV